MTALRKRRQRRTVFGGVAAMVLMIGAMALTLIGLLTLRDSEEGETVGVDDRLVEAFPATPNLALAVTDDEGRLTSLVVATLLPEGLGGSIVTVPVNGDANIGLGPTPQPLASVFTPENPEGLRETVESLLSIVVERVEVADAERLAELIGPVTPIEVDLPTDVIDSRTVGSGIVASAGPQMMRLSVAVDALTAVDDSVPIADQHPNKVEIWSAIAREAPTTAKVAVSSVDGQGPPAPVDHEEFFRRLWSGPVQARDLDTDAGLTALAENPDDVDMVVVDRRDSLLVFTQISPSLVSTPNEGLTFRLEVRYSDEQLAAADSDRFSTRSQVARTLIGELLFFSANVNSVDEAPATDGAPEVTRIEVAQELFVDELEVFAPLIFGEAEVVVATTLLDGVDAVVTLGTAYLDAELR